MKRLLLVFWNLAYPLMVVLAAPFWIYKMLRRGGWGTGLRERIGIYDREVEFEKVGGIYIHAVSVGEVLLALKLIEVWKDQSQEHFVLVPTTATGMAVARQKALDGIRVIYAPLDFGFLVRRVMRRFEPKMVLMVESELWPQLIHQSSKMGIPMGLINARLSSRSGRRLKHFRKVVAPFLSQLKAVGVPEQEDLVRWQEIGVLPEATVVTGNVKFDPGGAALPCRREQFQDMLQAFGSRPVVMALSTFAGEEQYLAEIFREVGALPVIVPRHAERRFEVSEALNNQVILRSHYSAPKGDEVFVIDSTGELRDWTAHADVAVIGKSFFAKGGQNPTEAILAGVPVICGLHMDNFEPLVSELQRAGGILIVENRAELISAIQGLLTDSKDQVSAAKKVLERHQGAIKRTIDLFSLSEDL